MDDRIERARSLVRRASDLTDKSDVREQLRSIDIGIEDLEAADEDVGPDVEGDRLEEVEMQLAKLMDDVEGPAESHIKSARDLLDAYRQGRTRDW